MEKLSFFNWSVSKALDLEPDPIDKARMKLVIQSIILGIIYCCTFIPFHIYEQQPHQLLRTSTILLIFITVAKYLLYRPAWKPVTHITLLIMSAVIWTSIFIYSGIDLLMIQFAVIIILSSFYLLNAKWGILYSALSVIPFPVFAVLTEGGYINLQLLNESFGIISFSVALSFNMFLIVFIHYHFFQVFSLYISELNGKSKELEELITTLESSKKELQAKNNSQKTLIMAIAHDIKSPLKFLSILTKRLLNVADLEKVGLKENTMNELKMIQDSSFKLYNVTDNLLQYIKLGNDEHINFEAFNLYDLVEYRIKAFVEIVHAQNNTIVNSVNPAAVVNGSKELLGIILHNILDNAVKFTENGRILFETECINNELYLNLSDTGRGMSPALLGWCNAPFDSEFPQDENTNNQGIGLIIVKELLHKIGTVLAVTSEHGKGTTVRININSACDLSKSLLQAPPGAQFSSMAW